MSRNERRRGCRGRRKRDRCDQGSGGERSGVGVEQAHGFATRGEKEREVCTSHAGEQRKTAAVSLECL